MCNSTLHSTAYKYKVTLYTVRLSTNCIKFVGANQDATREIREFYSFVLSWVHFLYCITESFSLRVTVLCFTAGLVVHFQPNRKLCDSKVSIWTQHTYEYSLACVFHAWQFQFCLENASSVLLLARAEHFPARCALESPLRDFDELASERVCSSSKDGT
jgi:hypothetical protein